MRPGVKEVIVVGRGRKTDVMFNLAGISWNHAEIRLVPRSVPDDGAGPWQLSIRDTSSNGTAMQCPGKPMRALVKGVHTPLPHGATVCLPYRVLVENGQNEDDMRKHFTVQLDAPPPTPVIKAKSAGARASSASNAMASEAKGRAGTPNASTHSEHISKGAPDVRIDGVRAKKGTPNASSRASTGKQASGQTKTQEADNGNAGGGALRQDQGLVASQDAEVRGYRSEVGQAAALANSRDATLPVFRRAEEYADDGEKGRPPPPAGSEQARELADERTEKKPATLAGDASRAASTAAPTLKVESAVAEPAVNANISETTKLLGKEATGESAIAKAARANDHELLKPAPSFPLFSALLTGKSGGDSPSSSASSSSGDDPEKREARCGKVSMEPHAHRSSEHNDTSVDVHQQPPMKRQRQALELKTAEPLRVEPPHTNIIDDANLSSSLPNPLSDCPAPSSDAASKQSGQSGALPQDTRVGPLSKEQGVARRLKQGEAFVRRGRQAEDNNQLDIAYESYRRGIWHVLSVLQIICEGDGVHTLLRRVGPLQEMASEHLERAARIKEMGGCSC